MKMIVDGKEVSPDGFCYNDHTNFCQRQRYEPSSLADFEMTIPRAEFIERFDARYEEVRKEMLGHYEQGTEHFDDEDGLFVLGFGPLSEAFAKPEALEEIIDTYLLWHHSSLDKAAPSCVLDGYFDQIKWDGKQIIDGVEEGKVDAQGVTMRGFFHLGQPQEKSY